MSPFTRPTKGFWVFINALLLLTLWLFSTGPAYLQGVPTEILEGLAHGTGLTVNESTPLFYNLFALLPGQDSLFSAQALVAVSKVIAYLLLWFSVRRVWDNIVSPTLFCAVLFFAPPFEWVLLNSPEQMPALLFKVLAAGAIVGAKVPLLCAGVLGITPFDPAGGLSLYFVMVYLALRRQDSYGLGLVGVTIVGSGAILLGLASDYTLSPSFSGIRAASALCLISLLGKEIRASRTGLYLAMLAASLVTGAAEWASVVCLGDLALVGLRAPTSEESVTDHHLQAGDWSFHRATLVSLVALPILYISLFGAEQRLNRQILVPAQKARISLGKLFLPFSLHTFARETRSGRWDFGSPVPALGPQDLEVLEGLHGPFRLLTAHEEALKERRLGLLAALLVRQPLRGWSTPESLSASSLACKAVQDNVLTNDETVVFLGEKSGRAVPPASLPKDLTKLATVSLGSLWSLPFRQQVLSSREGAAYRLKTDETDEVLFFAKSKALLCLGAAPCEYQLSTVVAPIEQRTLTVGEWKLSMKLPNLDEAIPSRSLVPVKVRLTNEGASPVSTHETTAIAFEVFTPSAQPSLRQPFPDDFILFPKECLETELMIPTPVLAGRFTLKAAVFTSDGRRHPVKIENPDTYVTWLRLPPVGTWVEEPPTP